MHRMDCSGRLPVRFVRLSKLRLLEIQRAAAIAAHQTCNDFFPPCWPEN